MRHRLVPLLLVLSLGCDGGGGTDAGPGVDTGMMPGDSGGTDGGGSAGTFIVDFNTSAGNFAMEVTEAWAPIGAARVRELVESGYYDGAKFFRVVPGFVVQFGISGDPTVSAMWRTATIADDPVMTSNVRGTVTFATAGPGTRTTQLFVNFADNGSLDAMGFAPIGTITEGMENVDAINAEYGQRPEQSRIHTEGDAYLTADFPRLDVINAASIR